MLNTLMTGGISDGWFQGNLWNLVHDPLHARYPECEPRVRWLLASDVWTDYEGQGSSYIDGWPVGEAIRRLIGAKFYRNSSYIELYNVYVDKFILFLARMNEYLAQSWACSWRIPDRNINEIPPEDFAYEIRTYTIKASSLVAFLNSVSTSERFRRKMELRSQWIAESRAAADIAIFKANLTIFNDILIEYEVPPKYSPAGNRVDEILGKMRYFVDDGPIIQHLRSLRKLKRSIPLRIFDGIDNPLHANILRIHRYVLNNKIDFGLVTRPVYREFAYRMLSYEAYKERSENNRVWINEMAHLNDGTIATRVEFTGTLDMTWHTMQLRMNQLRLLYDTLNESWSKNVT